MKARSLRAPNELDLMLDRIAAKVFKTVLAEFDAKRAAESGKIRKGEKDGFATDAT